MTRAARAQAVGAGVSAALLGYAGSIAVVIAGLRAVGAGPGQVTTALAALGVLCAVSSILLSRATRIPVAVVWSTPGVAVLAAAPPIDGGFGAAVGAFLLVGAGVVVAGLVPVLPRLLARLPPALTAALLAGVLLPFCLAAARGVTALPLSAGAIALAWLAAWLWRPAFAAPAALLALVGVAVAGGTAVSPEPLALGLVRPTLSAAAIVSLALPVFLVTMTAQNLVGAAVLRTYGYQPALRPILLGTGAASIVGAPFGAPVQNLAAITGALTAGPGAGPDPGRRWVAAVAAGVTQLLLALAAPVAAPFVVRADPRLVATAAGLALLPALGGAVHAALAQEHTRLPALVTLVVTASGAQAAGLGSATLGLVAGAGFLLLLRRTAGHAPEPGTTRVPGSGGAD